MRSCVAITLKVPRARTCESSRTSRVIFHRSPDQLGPEQIREYTAHLFRDRKVSDNSVNQRVGALRFFFRKVLKRPWDGDEMPYPKKRIHLPIIWSPEEVASLIDAAPIAF